MMTQSATSPVATVVEQRTSSEAVSDSNEAVAVICSMTDVVCENESDILTIAPRPEQMFPVASDVEVSYMDKLLKVCKGHGLDKQCAKDLYAMAYHESRFNCDVVGDQGRSYGCFQIQVKMHKVSKDFARDFEKAANWSLERMIGNGYAKGLRTYAVKRHNGMGVMADRYAAKVVSMANKMK